MCAAMCGVKDALVATPGRPKGPEREDFRGGGLGIAASGLQHVVVRSPRPARGQSTELFPA